MLCLLTALGGGLPLSLSAQTGDRHGGLFGDGYYYGIDGLVNRTPEHPVTGGLMNQGFGATGSDIFNQSFGGTGGDLTNQGFGAASGGITNQTFGEAPAGSGLFILLAAGAGYACLKRSKKQKVRSKKNFV